MTMMTYEHYRNLISKIIRNGIKGTQDGVKIGEVIKDYRAKAIENGMNEKDCRNAENDALATAEILFAYARHQTNKK